MPNKPCVTDGSDEQHEAADGGYFAPLAPVRYMRLTTFRRDGIPVSASVHGIVDGDRAYFRAGSKSGTVNRLRHTDAVQVTPCGLLGFCTYGPQLDAIARPLQGEEASLVAAELDRKCPVRRGFLIRVLRRQAVYYELIADDAAADRGRPPGGLPASLITRVHMTQGFMHADAATPTSLAAVCTPLMTPRGRPSSYTQITIVNMSPSAPRQVAEAQADHGAPPAPEDSQIQQSGWQAQSAGPHQPLLRRT